MMSKPEIAWATADAAPLARFLRHLGRSSFEGPLRAPPQDDGFGGFVFGKVLKRLLAPVCFLGAVAIASAAAQTYPSRPVTMIVPYPAGGPTDTIARVLAERMQTSLGEPVVIENITGAGGSIGIGRVAHAAADGYTIAIGHVQTHVFNPVIMKLNYDVVKDFAPVALVADTPIWIIARKSLPANDLKSLIAWLKSQNGKATMGTVGVGGPTDVAARIFEKHVGVSFQIVPYRGGAPPVQDMLGDHIDFAFGQAATYLGYVREGQLKAYAVLQPKRWWAAPEVPTLDELGITDIDASFWHGIWVPKGTPDEAIAKLNAAVRAALADPKVQARFKAVGQEVWPANEQTPAALAAKQKAEIARWSPVIKEAGISVQ
jgi:tripartite-type tricarboxylate transporter receptor subunit TctC